MQLVEERKLSSVQLSKNTNLKGIHWSVLANAETEVNEEIGLMYHLSSSRFNPVTAGISAHWSL